MKLQYDLGYTENVYRSHKIAAQHVQSHLSDVRVRQSFHQKARRLAIQ